jgi:hypothetical protein
LVVPEPSKWIDIIYNGKSFIDVLEMNSESIRKIVENKELSEIVLDSYLRSFDLSIQQFQYNPAFGFRKRFRNIETVIKANDPAKLVLDGKLLKYYQDTLMDPGLYKKFLHIDNFCFSKDRQKLATKDFRVLLDDLSGVVPRDELLNAASIASLMLSGAIEYPIGHDYILEMMKRYGYAEFTYISKGYIHISIDKEKSNNIKYRKPADGNSSPKS